MMHSACKVLLDQQHFPMGMSTFTPTRSPRSLRSVPRTAWATCGRAGNMMASPWASAPPVPPPGRPDHGHGPRTSTRSRLRSATAAHGGSGPTFASSTRSRAPITRTTHHRPLSPFQTLHGREPESPELGFVTGRHQMTSLCDAMVGRPGAFGFPVWRCTPGVALLVREGTPPGRRPAAVGADWPCTPPRARAFSGTVPGPDTYS